MLLQSHSWKVKGLLTVNQDSFESGVSVRVFDYSYTTADFDVVIELWPQPGERPRNTIFQDGRHTKDHCWLKTISLIFRSNLLYTMRLSWWVSSQAFISKMAVNMAAIQMMTTKTNHPIFKHILYNMCSAWPPIKNQIIKCWCGYSFTICSQPCKHPCQLLLEKINRHDWNITKRLNIVYRLMPAMSDDLQMDVQSSCLCDSSYHPLV